MKAVPGINKQEMEQKLILECWENYVKKGEEMECVVQEKGQ